MDRNIIGVFGTAGSGKTTWIKEYIKKVPRVLILENGLEEFDGETFYEKPLLARYLFNRGRFSALYIDPDAEDEDSLEDICEVAVEYTKYCKAKFHVVLNLLLVVDEAQNYTSPYKIGRKFKKTIMLSRHYSIQLIYSSQRPSQISRNLTSQSSKFIIFNLQEKRDVDFFYGFIGKEATQIPTLRPFHYLECDLVKHTVIKKMLL